MEPEQPRSAIPPHAKRVFKGKIFEVWQWDQELFDGTTTIFEKLRRPDTVEVIATTPDGKILIEEQEQPGKHFKFFCLPGGRADGGEAPLEEAKREFLEETGRVSDDWELFQSIQPFFDNDYRVHYFFARKVRKLEDPKLEAGERITLHEISFDELLMFSEHPQFRGSEFARLLLEMRLNQEKREAFRVKLFG